ncbi:MAG TPA: transcriptional regulator [Puia sp.]|jgi:HTH-type transcriptional regulator/antitoxin HigA
MQTLKYTVIRSKEQYDKYCKKLEQLLDGGSKSKSITDEIDLLTLLIESWDEKHNTLHEVDPIRLLHSFMDDHKMKAKDLVDLLEVSKGYVSDILHYKKGLSKEVIRKLAERFKVSQEAFNRPYKLKSPANAHLRNASVMNTRKELAGRMNTPVFYGK